MTPASRFLALVAATQLVAFAGALAGAIQAEPSASLAALLESPALQIISDEDQANVQAINRHIEEAFANFKTLNEVHAFLDKVKLLVQKHPKNVAFARGDLKHLHKFLSSEIVTRLIRVDTEPFILPIGDDRLPIAQRAVDEDELTGRLFGAPLRKLVEAKKQQLSRTEDGSHKDSNIFTSFWCRILGSCSN